MGSMANAFCFTEMQQDQPQLYDSLIKVLNPDEQQIIQSVIAHADAINAPPQAAQMNGGAR